MSANAGCCGSDIKTCAKIIAIVGIILSALSLLVSILVWLYIPSSLSLLVAFVLVVIGLNRDRPGNLTAANIILIINIIIDALLAICCIYVAISVPQEVVDSLNNSGYWSDAKTDLQIGYSVFAALLFVVIGLLIFAFTIFRKARLNLVQNPRRCSVFPLTFSGQPPPHSHAPPVYIPSPPYPSAAPSYSVAGYPSGYGSNLPMYPQTYNGTPQLPPRGYNIDTTPFQAAYPQGYPTNPQMNLPVYGLNPAIYSQNSDTSPTVYQNENPSKIEMH